jgi:hypothetical protein
VVGPPSPRKDSGLVDAPGRGYGRRHFTLHRAGHLSETGSGVAWEVEEGCARRAVYELVYAHAACAGLQISLDARAGELATTTPPPASLRRSHRHL